MIYLDKNLKILDLVFQTRTITKLKCCTGTSSDDTAWMVTLVRRPNKKVYEVKFIGELKLEYNEGVFPGDEICINRESNSLISFSTTPGNNTRYWPIGHSGQLDKVNTSITPADTALLAMPAGCKFENAKMDAAGSVWVTYRSNAYGSLVKLAIGGMESGYVYYFSDTQSEYNNSIQGKEAIKPFFHPYGYTHEIDMSLLKAQKDEEYNFKGLKFKLDFPWGVKIGENRAVLLFPRKVISITIDDVTVKNINTVVVEYMKEGYYLKLYRRNKEGADKLRAILPIYAPTHKGMILADQTTLDVVGLR